MPAIARAVAAQAELWLMETPNRKRRRGLVASRDKTIAILDNGVALPTSDLGEALPDPAHRQNLHRPLLDHVAMTTLLIAASMTAQGCIEHGDEDRDLRRCAPAPLITLRRTRRAEE